MPEEQQEPPTSFMKIPRTFARKASSQELEKTKQDLEQENKEVAKE